MAAWTGSGPAPGSGRGTSCPPSPGSTPGTPQGPHARRPRAGCAGGRPRPRWARSRRRPGRTPAGPCPLRGDRSYAALCHPRPARSLISVQSAPATDRAIFAPTSATAARSSGPPSTVISKGIPASHSPAYIVGLLVLPVTTQRSSPSGVSRPIVGRR